MQLQTVPFKNLNNGQEVQLLGNPVQLAQVAIHVSQL